MEGGPTGGPGSRARSLRDAPKMSFIDMVRFNLGNGRGRNDMRSGLEELFAIHGEVVRQGVGPLQIVNLFGPDANRLVLLDRDRIFSARKPWMLIMGKIFPNGLLLFDGESHKHHRKIMHAAFQRPVLRGYVERMTPMVESGLDAWGRNGGSLLAFDALKELTLDLATSIFVGADVGPESRTMNQAFEDMVAASMSRLRLPIPGLEFHRGLEARRFMLAYLGGMLDKKRNGEGEDMFSRLCHAESETGDTFSDQQVLDHMIFLMMAAHDTTTSTLTSMTYELARHQDWQERLREESRALSDVRLGFDDLDRLEGLGLVMREVLRLYPPLPVIPRIATEAFEFGGYRLPRGIMVAISPVHTHYMEEWWDAPRRFDPERFAPARAEHERHSHSWVPFGGGPHMCLGRRFAEAQTRLVMHQMLLRHRWTVPEGYEMPVQQAPISKPRDGLPIQIQRID